MELITGFSNPPKLEALNKAAMRACDSVEAAVAYVTDERTLIESCFKGEVRLTLWARYDYSMPVSEDVLQRFLTKRSPNFTIRIVPDIFHPKVIWWHGFGAYIGSANLTQRAWSGGIEAGLFLTDDELAQQGLDERLSTFFQEVDDRSYPVNSEFLAHVREIEKQNASFYREEENARRRLDEARKALGIGKLTSLFSINAVPAEERRRAEFLKEWNETLQILRDIAGRMSENQPGWIREDAPPGAQADRFLHAYYVNWVTTGESVNKLYQQNKSSPELALSQALAWWQSLEAPPSRENEMLNESLPAIQKLLHPQKLLLLTSEELSEVCMLINALRNHARQASYASLGLPDAEQTTDDKVRQFGHWLFNQHAPNGRSAVETIYRVLYGGIEQLIPHRIFEASFLPAGKVPRLGVNSLGEIVGWVRPDFSPPRNNRTNKALRALGYNVKVYGL